MATSRATAEGCCPACSTRISWLDAAWRGRNKPFECHGCGQMLVKTSIRMWVVMGATFAGLLVFQRSDDWNLRLVTIALLAIGLVVDARLRSPIRLAGTDSAQSNGSAPLAQDAPSPRS